MVCDGPRSNVREMQAHHDILRFDVGVEDASFVTEGDGRCQLSAPLEPSFARHPFWLVSSELQSVSERTKLENEVDPRLERGSRYCRRNRVRAEGGRSGKSERGRFLWRWMLRIVPLR